ncbi:MAG: radical SAM protein [Deltaproteobacteria bacterium]|nr:radical SAM protein [Deltaproteobacteria bacterium]MBU51985.1 radical SAM protein [Deltaproteobacteria bacterium]
MATRSRLTVNPSFFIKNIYKSFREDWKTAYSFMRFQAAKESWNLRHRNKEIDGTGDKIELVSLRITDMCNLRCHSCGQWGDNGYLVGTPLKELKQREVPVERYKKLVDDVMATGSRPIWYIWGGEPMLYPGIIELLYYIKERGMPISLVTNGTHVAKRAEELLDTLKILHVSVDGPNPEIHNAQRPGVSKKHDNFKAVEAGLKAISDGKKARGQTFPYLVPISCITSYNIDYLADLYDFTSQYADAQMLYLTWWIDAQSAAEHTHDFERRFGFKPKTHYGWIGTWKDFDYSKLLDKYDELWSKWEKSGKCPPVMMPRVSGAEEIEKYYLDHSATFGYDQCVSIYMTVEIDSNGDVSYCRDYHDYIVGNIREESILDIWNNEKSKKFRKSITKEGIMPVCRRCCGLMGF